ncbi:MAG TPA: subclass B3 metallo-beta-lactamase [Acidobacteriaceae bacterium]
MLRFSRLFAALFFACLLSGIAAAKANPAWTTPLPPFQIADHLYYVGSRDLAAYLVTTPAGNILINANLATSPPQIRASVERLGLRWMDTKILLNGQAHFDHMAGAAEVLRETHAQDMVMEGDSDAVRSGGRNDFAFGMSGMQAYAPARVDRVLHDGDTVTLGGTTLTAHKTAGHSRGCTTWTLRTHMHGDPPATLREVVIVGGLWPLSQYQLVDAPGHKASYPGIEKEFQQTFDKLRALPCDIFLGSHGVYFDLLPKLARMPAEGEAVFLDRKGYLQTVNDAQAGFGAMVARQSGRTMKAP